MSTPPPEPWPDAPLPDRDASAADDPAPPPAAAVFAPLFGAGRTASAAAPKAAARKRAVRPGERREQVLQALAAMLEQPGAERITTASLAARLGVSEAALYRHFASKAQMFDALIDYVESVVFSRLAQVAASPSAPDGRTKAAWATTLVLQFGEKNPGLSRVMVGDALVLEHARLTERMNRFFDRFEAQLRQWLREAAEADAMRVVGLDGRPIASGATPTPSFDAQVAASGLVALVTGRLQRWCRSGFKRAPTEHLEPLIGRIVG